MASSSRQIVEPQRWSHSPGGPGLKVLWVGPTTNGLGWLHERIASYRSPATACVEVRMPLAASPKTIPTATLSATPAAVASDQLAAALQPLVDAGADRLILACSHRLDYPQEAIQWLRSYAPELPLAVATDTWWDGARRTGLGGLTHLTLPWHRWWDGWSDWLDATSSDWFGPCVLPATFGMERRPAKAEVIQVRTPRRGAVVANCRQTAEAWCLVARQAGADVDWWSTVGWQALIGGEAGTAPSAVDWLLWDDSCLDTAGGATDGLAERGDGALTDCLGFIQQARRLLPQTRIFCGCSIPRWADWEPMQRQGANELLSKPNTGRGLQRLLEIQ